MTDSGDASPMRSVSRLLGLRARVFLVSLVLVGAFAASSGWWFARRMREVLTQDVEETLFAHGMSLAQLIPDDVDPGTLVTLSDQVGYATGTRVTIIRSDGVVLADSEVADESQMDNHGTRPEVLAALGPAGYGLSLRHSDTLNTDMLYVAVPWAREGAGGVVRVARPLTEVEAELSRLRAPLWVAGVGGLLLSVILAGVFTQLVTRDLRALTVRARALARPGGDRGADEIAWITGSIDRLANELRRAVDDVAQERNRLHAVLGSMREAVIAVDSAGNVRLTNPAARSILGVDAGSQGTPLSRVVEVQELLELVTRALEAGLPGAAELQWPNRREPHAPLQILATTTPQVGGGAVIVLHDVTELRRLEAVRRDFVANVSHELRTPVAVIQSSAEALLDGAIEDPVHGPRFVDAINRHAQRLGTLITDLLDLARIEAGGRVLDLHAVRLRPVVNGVVRGLADRADKRGQTVAIYVPGNLSVAGDPVALEQILVNLVDNAIKYANEGGYIEISAESIPEGIQLDVSDDGPGIGEAHRTRVFERFYRVDPGRSRDMGGTGLGLAIVRHLVEAQGGAISVHPNEPRGTRMRVILRAAEGRL